LVPAALRRPNGNVVRVFRAKTAGKSGSPPASCVMTLIKEKVRLRKSSWDGWGPRKTLS
jgi:hypothetical protein